MDILRKNALTIALGIITGLLFILYLPLNQPRMPLHHLMTVLDQHIPLVPIFIVPYLSLYFYLAVAILIFIIKKQRDELHVYLLANILVMVVAYTAYGFFQTYVLRPEIVSHDLFSRMVHHVYTSDNPYNDCPSLHAAFSALAALAIYRVYGKRSILFVLWGVCIAISTVFVKQHYVIDVVTGVILAYLSYSLSKYAFIFSATK